MKYCEEYAALLDLYVDGELAVEELERVQAHLEACPGCRAYVDDALAIRAGFPDVEDTVVPEGFAGGVMARIRETSEKDYSEKDHKVIELRRRSVRRRVGMLAALAACCALVILMKSGTSGVSGGAGSGGGLATASRGADTGAPAAYSADEEIEAAVEEMQDAKEVEIGGETEVRLQTTCRQGEDRAASDSAPSMEFTQGPLASPQAAAAPEEAYDNDGGVALYLPASEAGALLEGFTPVEDDGEERRYELSAEDYQALLEALGRWNGRAKADSAEEEGPITVVVTGPFE